MNTQTKTTTAATQPWTAQRENFHWIYRNIKQRKFFGKSYMVELNASRITLGLSKGKLVIKVGADGRTTFTFENGAVSHSAKPYFVPSRQIEDCIDDFVIELRSLGYL